MGRQTSIQGLTAALLIAAATATPAQVLTLSRDADGRLVYRDGSATAPAPADAADAAPSATADTRSTSKLRPLARRYREVAKDPAPQAPAFAADEVVLFAADWCGYCRQARAYMAARGIRYTEINADTEVGRRAMAAIDGGSGIPLLVVGSRRHRGFSVASYDRMFQPR